MKHALFLGSLAQAPQGILIPFGACFDFSMSLLKTSPIAIHLQPSIFAQKTLQNILTRILVNGILFA